MAEPVKRVGRFQLAAKPRGMADVWRRLDGAQTNLRPSSSGSGRKLTQKQRATAGFDKSAELDPRYLQYGLPALLGLLLGGRSNGILGALLGAGAGHFLMTPENQSKIRDYFQNLWGGGANVGSGSSAEPAAPPPLSTATRSDVANTAKAVGDAQLAQAPELVGTLLAGGANPEAAYRNAGAQTQQFLNENGVATPGTGAVGNDAYQMAQKDPRGYIEARTNALAGRQDPNFGLGFTTPGFLADLGTQGYEVASGQRPADMGDAMTAAIYGVPRLGMIPRLPGMAAEGLATLPQLLGSGLGAGARGMAAGMVPWTMLGNAMGTAGDVISSGMHAPIKENLPFWERMGQRASAGVRAGGGAFVESLYGNTRPIAKPGVMGAIGSVLGTTGQVLNPVGQAFGARAAHDIAMDAQDMAKRRVALSGANTGTDATSKALRQRVSNTDAALGQEGWWAGNPLTRVAGGFGTPDPRNWYQAGKNVARWWGRRLGL